MDWLKKLPNSVRSASGLEWRLWRKLPLILVAGSALPVLVALVLHGLADQSTESELRWLQTMDYMVFGVVVFHWTAVLTLAIGCVVVMLMKGPGYVADGMELSHRDKPRPTTEQADHEQQL
jgi:predicted benzoate:H+ symporter BenE